MNDELPEPQGDRDLIVAVGDHCERFLGPCQLVWDEIESEFVHVDIHQFGPDPISGLVTFVTSGMAEKPMNVPPQVPNPQNYRYAELLLQMPKHLVEEYGTPSNWPLKTLSNLARMPHKYESWLWGGHTIGDTTPQSFPGTNLSVAAIWPCFLMPDEFETLEMDDGRSIVFLTLGFLNAEEREYSKQHTQEGFMKEIERQGRNLEEFLILNPKRAGLFDKKKPFWNR